MDGRTGSFVVVDVGVAAFGGCLRTAWDVDGAGCPGHAVGVGGCDNGFLCVLFEPGIFP